MEWAAFVPLVSNLKEYKDSLAPGLGFIPQSRGFPHKNGDSLTSVYFKAIKWD